MKITLLLPYYKYRAVVLWQTRLTKPLVTFRCIIIFSYYYSVLPMEGPSFFITANMVMNRVTLQPRSTLQL